MSEQLDSTVEFRNSGEVPLIVSRGIESELAERMLTEKGFGNRLADIGSKYLPVEEPIEQEIRVWAGFGIVNYKAGGIYMQLWGDTIISEQTSSQIAQAVDVALNYFEQRREVEFSN